MKGEVAPRGHREGGAEAVLKREEGGVRRYGEERGPRKGGGASGVPKSGLRSPEVTPGGGSIGHPLGHPDVSSGHEWVGGVGGVGGWEGRRCLENPKAA